MNTQPINPASNGSGWALGDVIERALSTTGITKERVERWVGGPCGCRERQEKLNAVGLWARRVLAGRLEHAVEYLAGIMGGQ